MNHSPSTHPLVTFKNKKAEIDNDLGLCPLNGPMPFWPKFLSLIPYYTILLLNFIGTVFSHLHFLHFIFPDLFKSFSKAIPLFRKKKDPSARSINNELLHLMQLVSKLMFSIFLPHNKHILNHDLKIFQRICHAWMDVSKDPVGLP